VLKDPFTVYDSESGFGEFPGFAVGETLLKGFPVMFVQKMERATAWLRIFVGECYCKLFFRWGLYFKRS
jgi:hypothetical protein